MSGRNSVGIRSYGKFLIKEGESNVMEKSLDRKAWYWAVVDDMCK